MELDDGNTRMHLKYPPSTPRRVLLMVTGVVSVVLATVGIVVPLLPTTPLLLLAAACFVRSSDSLYEWLTNHRLFGSYIRDYREYRAVTWQTKAFTLILLWIAIWYSGFVLLNSWAVRVILLVIATAVTAHVISLRTISKKRGFDAGNESQGDQTT